MNAPAPGWNPDPTGRHEYRYWDGGRWTDDVSDNGVTSTDALGGPTPPGADTTATTDPTRQFGQQPGPYAPGPGAPTGTGAYPGATPTGPAGSQFGPGGPSGPGFPPATPPKSGPKKTGLIIGIAAAVVAVIAVAAVIAMQGGDDKTDAQDVAATSETTATAGSGQVTLPPTTAGSNTTTPGNDGDGKISGVDEDVVKSAMTAAFENEGMSHQQAECVSNVMIDQFGDRLADIGASSNPLSQVSSDDMSRIFQALSDCGIDPSDLAG